MKDFARQFTQKCVSMGLLDESYSEWFAWTSNGYREQTKDFDIPASQKNWTKYPDSSWAGVLVDATNHVGCYYVVNIAAKTGKTWYVEISNNIR